MTKSTGKIVRDGRQMSLLALLTAARQEKTARAPGRLNIAARLDAAARTAIRNAKKSREIIAEEMAELTGVQVTVSMLNNWTAESHPHRMPAEMIPAFCLAAGDTGMIEVLAEAAEVFLLPGPDALRSEIRRLDEEARRIRDEKRKRELFLKEMER